MPRSLHEKKEIIEYPVQDYRTEGGEDTTAQPIQQKTKQKAPKPKRSKPPKEFHRSFGDVLRSRIFIGFICVFVALAIAFIGVPMVQGMISERVPVLTVAMDLERGTLLTADMLTVSEIGVIDRPSNAAISPEQVVGTFTKYDMLQGDIVVSSKLSRERPLSNPYLYDLPPGKSAISISVQGLAEGLSGKLKPGDIVSIYAVFNKSDAEEEYTAMQPPELTYVKVLAVSNSYGTDIDVDGTAYDATGDKDRERLPSTVTLLAGSYQAAALAGLDRNATIHISLAARATNVELCEDMLAAQEEYILELEAEAEAKEADEDSKDTDAASNNAAEESAQEPGADESGVEGSASGSEVSGPGQTPAPVNG